MTTLKPKDPLMASRARARTILTGDSADASKARDLIQEATAVALGEPVDGALEWATLLLRLADLHLRTGNG